VFPDLIQSLEGDQAVSGADVKQRLPVGYPCLRQDPIAYRSQVGKRAFECLGISTVATMKEPLRPKVLHSW
jgi:hypothetical protein